MSFKCRKNIVDPEDPRCARLTLTGRMVAVSPEEVEFAKQAMFSRLVCGLSVCSYQTLKSYYNTGIRSAFLHVQIFVELLTRPGDGTPLQSSCLANPVDGGAWWAAVHGVAKSQTRLSDLPFTFHFHALEKEMATHSSVLAWRIPGTGEPGRLLSMGSHRVRYN